MAQILSQILDRVSPGRSGIAYRFGLNAVLAFWITYILTRPLGASLGDLLSQSTEYGGLGLGTVKTSIMFLVVIVLIVGILSINQNRHLKTAELNEAV